MTEISLSGRGARGESQADILRRTGQFGVLPTDTDTMVFEKVQADLLADLAADIDPGADAGVLQAALAASTGASYIGRPNSTNLYDELDQFVDLGRYPNTATGFQSAAATAMSSGKALYIHGPRTITGHATPIATTAPLVIQGDGGAISQLTFTSESASLFHVLHDLKIDGVGFINHTSNTSSNGGSIFYNVAADAIATPIKVSIKNCIFQGCQAPINFEDKFDNVLIEDCWFIGGTGHQIRTGTTTGFGAWGNWKNSKISRCFFIGITAVAVNQSVFATLQYGIGATVEHCYTDGVTGAGTGEAHAHYAQAQDFACLFNYAKSISSGAINRGMTNKGELNSRYSVFIGNHVEGGGTADCFAWYGGEGVMIANTGIDPVNAAVTVGSVSGASHSQFIGNNFFGTGRAGASAFSVTHDDGKLTFNGGNVSGFVKLASIDCRTGCTELIIDLAGDTNTGPLEIYTTNKLPKLTVKGTYKITNNSFCISLRGGGGFGQVVNNVSHTESSGGYGIYYDAPIDDLNHTDILSSGHGVGREVIFVANTPKRMNFEQTFVTVTTNATVTKLVEFPIANGQLLDIAARQNAVDNADFAITRKDLAFKSLAGSASLEGAENVAFQRRSTGATTWDLTSTFTTNKGALNVLGQAAKTVKHVLTVKTTSAAI